MPGIRDFVLTRALPFEAVPKLQPVTAAIKRAMGAYDSFEAEARKIAADQHLSPLGKREKVQGFVRTHAHELLRVRKHAEKAKARMAEKLKKLQPAPIDKADVASAMVRLNISQKISQMTPAERKVFFAGQLDSATCAAILEAPQWLTGINAEQRQTVLTAAIEAAHPGQLAQMEKDSEAIQLLEVASRVLSEMACEVAELPNSAALDDLVNTAVPDQRHLDGDAERSTAPLAA
jgi:hypothetical protein